MHPTIKNWVYQTIKKRPHLALAISWLYRMFEALRAWPCRLACLKKAYIANARVIGLSRLRLGRNVVIGNGSLLVINDRTSKSIALSLGDNGVFGPRNFFTVGRTIVIREYCLTAISCAFIGSAHVFRNPMYAYMTTGVTLDSDIYVGVNCFFGYGVVVLGPVRIGHGSVIGAGAVVRQDIPPFSLVVGAPAKVIKRFDFARQDWVKWPCEDLTEGPTEEAYLIHLRQQHGYTVHPISFAAASFGDVL